MPWSLARTRSTSRGFVEFVRGVHRRFSLCNPARRVRDGGAFLWGIRKFWQAQARTCSLPASRPGARAFRASPRPFLRAASTWDHEGGPCPRRRPLHLRGFAPQKNAAHAARRKAASSSESTHFHALALSVVFSTKVSKSTNPRQQSTR